MNLFTILKVLTKDSKKTGFDVCTLLCHRLVHYYNFCKYNNLLSGEELELLNRSRDARIMYESTHFEDKNWLSSLETPEFFKQSLLSVYPKFGLIKGKYYPLITGDIDKLFEDYAKKIGYSIDTHKEIMDIVVWAKNNEMLNLGIEKFVLSYYWESLKELMNKNNNQIINIADDF